MKFILLVSIFVSEAPDAPDRAHAARLEAVNAAFTKV
jgi:hypothetical protein